MPSPAEQVTDDLVSPKYDTEEDDATEEDDSDDTVYECPGLAAPGQEMVVTNPFFLKGRDMPHLHREGNQQPQPISQSSSLFHHGIKGVNWGRRKMEEMEGNEEPQEEALQALKTALKKII